ncbi:outer membrane beta-barrel family protein [Flavicella marina]|uniref:outer membrane beta-barrel family protein n=1 Tax=Flavicella marina TaxID=1475951 RepID=UPI0012642134|nr:outer membrane beta-barrel family protein [Flavicella marina]
MIYTPNKIYVNLVFFLTVCLSYAQQNSIELLGTVVEKDTEMPIPYASIVLYDSDTAQKAGTTTNIDGLFSLTTTSKNFKLEISVMGYETKTISKFENTNNRIDLGTIQIAPENKKLDEVVVRAEVSKTVFKLDKRVFNVGKDISSSGASALEALNNVPSVNVNIEGEISLRGSTSVQILVNGKPSVLADQSSNALGTISADMIESIEVITNPSAKYEASGTSGILNIILKKEQKEGWNGSISANTGTPDNHSLGASLNRRTENFNLFTQLGAGYRSLPQYKSGTNKNLISGETLYNEGTEYRNETFFNVTLGTDYHIDERNVLTLSGSFAYEIEDQPSETTYAGYDANDNLISNWVRTETTEATNPKFQYELNYKKEYKNNEEHSLIVSALGRYFAKDLSSEFLDTTISGSENNEKQQVDTDYKYSDYTFKADYINPINDIFTLETGTQYVVNSVINDYEVREWIEHEYIVNDSLSNNFEYSQNVLGVYGTFAYEKDKWGVKAGLRVENTDLKTLLTDTDESNKQNYTNLFPTLHTSYKIASDFSIQAGYSKRIFRPRLRNLNPFVSIRDNVNVRTGNPELQPEFTNSYELTSIFSLGKASLNSSLYYRYTTDVVETVYTFVDNITIATPQNIGTKNSIGFETNGKYNANNWLTFNGDFNYNYFERNGSYEEQSFDFVGRQWSARLGTKIRFPKDIDLELTGNYRSDYKTLQGTNAAYAFMDAGLRKKILKGKAIVTIGIRDVFNSRIYEQFVTQPTFERYSNRSRGRFFTLGISYGFGKGEAMTYSGGRRR